MRTAAVQATVSLPDPVASWLHCSNVAPSLAHRGGVHFASSAAPSSSSAATSNPKSNAGVAAAFSGLPERTSPRALLFLRAPAQVLLDIEAHALTEADPLKSASLAAYQQQFNDVLQKGLAVSELMQVFRSWLSHMPVPPSLPYIHTYIEARVLRGHRITQVLVDLIPLAPTFSERTIVHVMLLCAKQRSTEETLGALRFLSQYTGARIPFTLPLMNHMIDNFSRQNDISGAAILYDELTALGLSPDADTYRSMYLGFARLGEMEAAFSVVGHMQSRAGMALAVGVFEDIIEETVKEDNPEGGLLALQRIAQFAPTQPKAPNAIAGLRTETTPAAAAATATTAETTEGATPPPTSSVFPSSSVDAQLVVPPLVPSVRCFSLLLRAYLSRGALDTSLQIYYSLRAETGRVLDSAASATGDTSAATSTNNAAAADAASSATKTAVLAEGGGLFEQLLGMVARRISPSATRSTS